MRLVFASDRCDRLEDPWWDAAIPVRFHDMPSSVEAVVASFRGRAADERPDGVIAVGDRPTVLAAHVSAALDLPGNPPVGDRSEPEQTRGASRLRSGRLTDTSFRRSCPFRVAGLARVARLSRRRQAIGTLRESGRHSRGRRRVTCAGDGSRRSFVANDGHCDRARERA